MPRRWSAGGRGEDRMRSSVAVVAVTAVLLISGAQAEISGGVVRIGVLNDQSSLYADAARPGSVLAAQMALEDFGPIGPGIKVEVISADHQNKPDVGTAIVRRWLDVDGVDAILDVPNSGVALAVSEIVRGSRSAGLLLRHSCHGIANPSAAALYGSFQLGLE